MLTPHRRVYDLPWLVFVGPKMVELWGFCVKNGTVSESPAAMVQRRVRIASAIRLALTDAAWK